MKRLRIGIILICTALLLSGCQTLGKTRTAQTKSDTTRALVDALNLKDEQAVQQLMCVKTDGILDLSEQLRACFTILNGNIEAYLDAFDDLGEGSSREHGKLVALDNSWVVRDVRTDNGMTYTLRIHHVPLDPDPDRMGITHFTLTAADGTECRVGYPWADYAFEGASLSNKVISAISNADSAQLKALLCTSAQKNAALDAQMRSAFAAFNGTATFGRSADAPDKYDGDHDFHSTVQDKVMVTGGEPILIQLHIQNTNIETSTGNLYTLELLADLCNLSDPSLEGVQKIILRDNTTEYLIGNP